MASTAKGEIMDDVVKSAFLSPCLTYRYRLTRTWSDYNRLLGWIMLNPSTADDSMDDPTIRKCMKFARRWGYGGITVVNLFAHRSTDPKNLRKVISPIGPENDREIVAMAQGITTIVAAWGSLKRWHSGIARADVVRKLVEGIRPLHCLGWSDGDYPRHPLYMRDDSPLLELYPMAKEKVRA